MLFSKQNKSNSKQTSFMKVAVNLLPYSSYQGIETYTRNLINEMIKIDGVELILIKHQETPDFFDFGDKVTEVIVPFKKVSKAGVAIYLQTGIYFLLLKLKPDVLLSTSPASPYFYSKNVITFHDCAYDRFREFANIFSKYYFKSMYIAAKYFARKIITISEFSKRELIDVYKIKPSKIAVVLEGPPALPKVTITAVDEVKQDFNIHGKYFFYVGNSRPRKNLKRLIEAFGAFQKENSSYKLIIAGKIDNRFEDIDGIIAKFQLADSVVRTGFVTDEQKVALLKGAVALVFPSLYEGFGLPVLEAQTLGVPVITSHTSSLPEVGGNSVYYVDPYSEKSITEALSVLVADKELCSRLVEKGFENIKSFSWKQTAFQTLAVLEKSEK
ncbi:hypothetical protein COY25_04615 [Candidatus Uhrbacteria bacterium CG_4_10_14_0_2_um_filter_41_7]|nr:MAG: hypothetical protein COV92_02760 [Candidatus Uhrbacteria bacterium CG11_big_fil_rev_8_21_14_0_20_41_9]PIZ52744.1 MAG: hypothetical protein COY25_04615 [Candidatus Uhrbacteria bacterium CG_4_10_14_0_2_um_filter_41_7]